MDAVNRDNAEGGRREEGAEDMVKDGREADEEPVTRIEARLILLRSVVSGRVRSGSTNPGWGNDHVDKVIPDRLEDLDLPSGP